jgi:hypothetical protein
LGKYEIKSPISTKNVDIHPICSPEQRSLARKMGSSYSPKIPPQTKPHENVRKQLCDETFINSFTAYCLLYIYLEMFQISITEEKNYRN